MSVARSCTAGTLTAVMCSANACDASAARANGDVVTCKCEYSHLSYLMRYVSCIRIVRRDKNVISENLILEVNVRMRNTGGCTTGASTVEMQLDNKVMRHRTVPSASSIAPRHFATRLVLGEG